MFNKFLFLFFISLSIFTIANLPVDQGQKEQEYSFLEIVFHDIDGLRNFKNDAINVFTDSAEPLLCIREEQQIYTITYDIDRLTPSRVMNLISQIGRPIKKAQLSN